MLALRDLQRRFFGSIAGTPGPAASENFDQALVQVLEGRGPLGPADHLDIYAQMYWARLHDVLCEDFPRVAAILGAERFGVVVCAYLARNPSTHPSVRHVGRGFAAFLAGASEIEGLPFLADLARLEWARLAVFDAPDAQPLRVEDLRAVAPSEWPGLTFRLVPAVQLLRSAWPVQELWTAAEEGGPPERVRPAATSIRVWRDGFMVYQASMDAREQRALARVVRGEPFASVCAALEALMSPEEAAHEAAQLLLRWIEDGILGGFLKGRKTCPSRLTGSTSRLPSARATPQAHGRRSRRSAVRPRTIRSSSPPSPRRCWRATTVAAIRRDT